VGGDGAPNRRADVARIETFLAGTGHYKPLKDGPSGYVNDGLVEAIRAFQKDKGLAVDGRIDPGSPTISTLERSTGGRPGLSGEDILDKGNASKTQKRLTGILIARYDPSQPRKVAAPLPLARPGEGRIEPLSQRASGRSLLNFSGSDDAEATGDGGGASGMVHVRAYEQNRDGREVRVSEYDRRPPEGGAGAGQGSKQAGKRSADVDNFAEALDKNAEATSQSDCAKYVRRALQAAGFDVSGHPRSAKDWGPTLEKNGFKPLDENGYVPQKGDVVVIQPYEGGNKNGHMAAYDGKQWVSDFKQPGFWPGPGYRREQPPHKIYRLSD